MVAAELRPNASGVARGGRSRPDVGSAGGRVTKTCEYIVSTNRSTTGQLYVLLAQHQASAKRPTLIATRAANV
jgi:hypothetical protein